jgi:hypothetical protein
MEPAAGLAWDRRAWQGVPALVLAPHLETWDTAERRAKIHVLAVLNLPPRRIEQRVDLLTCASFRGHRVQSIGEREFDCSKYPSGAPGDK